VKLSEQFHMVLALPLTSFPFGRDFLTVWKRTRVISMAGVEIDGEEEEGEGEGGDQPDGNSQEEDESEGKGEGGESDEEEDGDDEWADICFDERMFGKSTVAAPAFAYLVNP
jgi:hypothetical protein